MTYRIREGLVSDTNAVYELSKYLNTNNLPREKNSVTSLLEMSEKSFHGSIADPFKRTYLFVLENERKKIIGTSLVIAQHGTSSSPCVYFKVSHKKSFSHSLSVDKEHVILTLDADYNGPTEIGGLVLHPDYRGKDRALGKQLSFVRFMFMSVFAKNFRDKVSAELLPPLGENGTSIFWDAIGAKFTGLSYKNADFISRTNKEFIKTLFTKDPINVSLLDEKVAKIIGQVGAETEAAKSLLEKSGFSYCMRIDPFDGGPHYEAYLRDILPVKNTKAGNLMVGNLPDKKSCGFAMLLTTKNMFKPAASLRVISASYFREGAQVFVSPESLSMLEAVEGDTVHVLDI